MNVLPNIFIVYNRKMKERWRQSKKVYSILQTYLLKTLNLHLTVYLMEFTIDRLYSLSHLKTEEYYKELQSLLDIIRNATEMELMHIDSLLSGYMSRGMDLLFGAVASRKLILKKEKRYKQTSIWSFFSKKPTQSIKRGEYTANHKRKKQQKIDFHSLPDKQDQNSLFQDLDTQLQFQIPN